MVEGKTLSLARFDRGGFLGPMALDWIYAVELRICMQVFALCD